VTGSVFSDLQALVRVYRGEEVFTGGCSLGGHAAAVVLGAQVRRGGRPSGVLLARARHAAGLYARGEVRVVVPTGGVGEHPPSEAEVMAEILREGGVPREKILLEDRARNTRESARLVAVLAREKRLEDLVVVTDPLHCVRTVGAFRAEGMDAAASPVYGSPMWRERTLRRGQLLREAAAIVGYGVRRWVLNV
jgi:uncharacterized SAM-binding protein YcdF (DUF218 family)